MAEKLAKEALKARLVNYAMIRVMPVNVAEFLTGLSQKKPVDVSGGGQCEEGRRTAESLEETRAPPGL